MSSHMYRYRYSTVPRYVGTNGTNVVDERGYLASELTFDD